MAHDERHFAYDGSTLKATELIPSIVVHSVILEFNDAPGAYEARVRQASQLVRGQAFFWPVWL